MYHIVYLTTNLVNQKIYVGVHSTYNLDDGYLGSGRNIQRAIKKYGKGSFKRDILYFCLTHEDAYIIEQSIVDKFFIKNKNTYNINIGGFGYGNIAGKTFEDMYSPEMILEYKNKLSITSSGQNNPASKTRMSDEKRKEKGQKSIKTKLENGKIKTGLSCNLSKEFLGEEGIKLKNNKSAKTYKDRISNGYIPKCRSKLPKYIAISPNGEEIIFQGFEPFSLKYNLSDTLLRRNVDKGIIQYKSKVKNPNPNYINTIGWEIKTYNK